MSPIPSTDFEPAWTTVHNAHLQERYVRATHPSVTATGYVVEIGDDYFIVRGADVEIRLPFDQTSVSFVAAAPSAGSKQ